MNLNDFATKITVTSGFAKKSYYKQSFTEHKNDSPAHLHGTETINQLTSRKSNTPSIKELIVNGVSINKTIDLANAFNEHFSTDNWPETGK